MLSYSSQHKAGQESKTLLSHRTIKPRTHSCLAGRRRGLYPVLLYPQPLIPEQAGELPPPYLLGAAPRARRGRLAAALPHQPLARTGTFPRESEDSEQPGGFAKPCQGWDVRSRERLALSLLALPILHQVPAARLRDVTHAACVSEGSFLGQSRTLTFPRQPLYKQPGSVRGWSSHTRQKHPFLISKITLWKKTFVLFLGFPPSLPP